MPVENISIEIVHTGKTLPESLKASWVAEWEKISVFPSHTYLRKKYEIKEAADIEFCNLERLFSTDPHVTGSMRMVGSEYSIKWAAWHEDPEINIPWGESFGIDANFTSATSYEAEVRVLEKNTIPRKVLEGRLAQCRFSFLQLPEIRIWSLPFYEMKDAHEVFDKLNTWFGLHGSNCGVMKVETREILRCAQFPKTWEGYHVIKSGCGEKF